MKLILVSALVVLGLSAAVSAGFNPKYIQKIIETAQEENFIFDPASAEPVQSRSTRATLNCPILNGGTPTSVHALRPQNIEIIGAIGDSLTAANGAKAKTVVGLLDECRGVSWSIGCEASIDKSVTFATILKYFNPNLIGCSTATSKQNSTASSFNFAHPGDTSFDMLPQAKMLVDRLQKTYGANLDNKWKVINFFIGGNDLCEACSNTRQTKENFKKNIREALDYFKQYLPRTFVNLVLTLDVSGIEELPGITCRTMQNQFCDCGLSQPYRPTLKALTKDYQQEIRNLIKTEARYENDDLFTVIYHEFMTEMRPPKTADGKPDYGYFAPDCFHFSVTGHEAAAIELWNSMLAPHPDKADQWNIGTPIQCPTLLKPYLYTSRNPVTLKSLLTN